MYLHIPIFLTNYIKIFLKIDNYSFLLLDGLTTHKYVRNKKIILLKQKVIKFFFFGTAELILKLNVDMQFLFLAQEIGHFFFKCE